jgi:hypothetical protein
MQTASWDAIEADLKLGVFLITVAAQSMLPDHHPAAGQYGKATLGKAFEKNQLASFQANGLEDLQAFDVSGTRFHHVARACFDLMHGRNPLDELDTQYFEAESLNWLGYFLQAVPYDEYATPIGGYSDRFRERRDKGDEHPLPGLHLSAAAKVNLASYLQSFPHNREYEIGFAPFEIAALAGMSIASVRNFVGPAGKKPIRSMPSEDSRGVYGDPLDTLEWLAGRRNFDPGPVSSRWLEQAAERAASPEDAGALLGIYAWVNRITTETLAERSGLPVDLVKNWTRGDIASPDDAAPLAEAAGIDPEFYTELVARCGGALATP